MAINDPTSFDWSTVGRSAGGAVTDQNTRTSGSIFDLLNPANARRAISGLFSGGASSDAKQAPNIGFQSQNAGGAGGATGVADSDWRVRISLPEGADYFYKQGTNNNVQAPLQETNGVIFPYTPSVTINHTAAYSSAALTHSNYPQMYFNSAEVSEISISGDFTVQSQQEGQYLLAVVYFLRAATKMFFGQGRYAGHPPPVVFLDGYGSHYFPHVPCVITSFSHTLPGDVDYIQVPITSTQLVESISEGQEGFVEEYYTDTSSPQRSGDTTSFVEQTGKTTNFGVEKGTVTNSVQTLTSSTRLPTTSTVTVVLKPVYSRSNLHDRFDLEKFARGELLQDSKTGYGGFI